MSVSAQDFWTDEEITEEGGPSIPGPKGGGDASKQSRDVMAL